MPTIVEKSIGVGGAAAGRDYSTLQAWEDACPANLVTADQVWKGVCYNDGEFFYTTGGDFGSLLSIAGITADATRYLWLTVAPGHSIFDNVNNPLRYDPTKGVGFRRGGPGAVQTSQGYIVFNQTVSNVVMERIQFEYTASPGSFIYAVKQEVGGCRTSYCLISCINNKATPINAYVANIHHYGGSIDNCVLINEFKGTENAPIIANITSGAPIRYCTFIARGNSGVFAVNAAYNPNVFTNCAIFGCNSLIKNSPAASSSSSYNITDGPFVIPGTNNKYGAKFTDCFNSYQDLRPKKDSPLTYGGVYDANYKTDAYGIVRTPGLVSIGAIQYVETINRTLAAKPEPKTNLISRDLSRGLILGLIPRITASTSSGTVAFNAYYNIVNPAYIGSFTHGDHTAPIVRGTPQGPAIISSGANVSGAFGGYAASNSANTILTVFMMPSTIINSRVLMATRSDGGWDGMAIALGNGTTGIVKSVALTNTGGSGIAFNSGGDNEVNSSYIPPANVVNCVAASYNSTTGHILAANGNIIGTNTASGNLVAGAGHINITGGRLQTASGTIHVYMVLWWNRALSQKELVEITSNPWKLVSSPNIVTPYITKFIPSKYDNTKKVPVDFEGRITKTRNQPQNNININDLNSSIVGAWNFNNLIRSDSTNTQRVTSTTGTFSLESSGSLTGLLFNGSSRFIVNRTPGYVAHPYSRHSILVVITPKSVASQQGIICLGELTDLNYTSAILIDSTGRAAWGAGYASGGIFNFGGSVLIPNKTYSILFVSDGTDLRRLYIDGQFIGTNTNSVTQSGATGGLGFGDYWLNASPRNQYFNGILHSAVIFNKSLNEAEALSLSGNPWQLFANPTAARYFLPSSLNRSPIKIPVQSAPIITTVPARINKDLNTTILWRGDRPIQERITNKSITFVGLTPTSVAFGSIPKFNIQAVRYPVETITGRLTFDNNKAQIYDIANAIKNDNSFGVLLACIPNSFNDSIPGQPTGLLSYYDTINPIIAPHLLDFTENINGGWIIATTPTTPSKIIFHVISGGSVEWNYNIELGKPLTLFIKKSPGHTWSLWINGIKQQDIVSNISYSGNTAPITSSIHTVALASMCAVQTFIGSGGSVRKYFKRIDYGIFATFLNSSSLDDAFINQLTQDPNLLFKSSSQIYVQPPLPREIGKPIPILNPKIATQQPKSTPIIRETFVRPYEAWLFNQSEVGLIRGSRPSVEATYTRRNSPGGAGINITATGRRYNGNWFSGVSKYAWLLIAVRVGSNPLLELRYLLSTGNIWFGETDFGSIGYQISATNGGDLTNMTGLNYETDTLNNRLLVFAQRYDNSYATTSEKTRTYSSIRTGTNSNTASGNLITTTNAPLCFGAAANGGGVASNWIILGAAIWLNDNIPKDGDFRTLVRNPWQLFDTLPAVSLIPSIQTVLKKLRRRIMLIS